MANINLHSIFCHLTGDDNFLSTVIEENDKDIGPKKNKQKKFNLMASMVTEYIPLSPYETQGYSMFPHKMKSYLTPEYQRFGIKNVIEKDMNVVNISFLSSLNILLRPDLYKATIDEQIRNFGLLESFICHKLHRNFQIDKTKNTKKVQAANREVIKNLSNGKISHEMVQYIINIFEVNLFVFDLTKMDIYFYWTKGQKYPYFNPFKDIYCMSYIQGNYEPVMTANNTISEEQKRKIYLQILANSSDFICMPSPKLSIPTMIYLNTWDVDPDQFNKIVSTYFPKKDSMVDYFKLLEFEKAK